METAMEASVTISQEEERQEVSVGETEAEFSLKKKVVKKKAVKAITEEVEATVSIQQEEEEAGQPPFDTEALARYCLFVIEFWFIVRTIIIHRRIEKRTHKTITKRLTILDIDKHF